MTTFGTYSLACHWDRTGRLQPVGLFLPVACPHWTVEEGVNYSPLSWPLKPIDEPPSFIMSPFPRQCVSSNAIRMPSVALPIIARCPIWARPICSSWQTDPALFGQKDKCRTEILLTLPLPLWRGPVQFRKSVFYPVLPIRRDACMESAGI